MRSTSTQAPRLLMAAVLIGGIVMGSPALAQETKWMPPEPSPETMDWIKLKSGEWLRGNIDLIRDDMLYFDSDKLDDLEIDWADIAEIRSPQVLTYTFIKGGVVTGTCMMRDGKVKIDTGTGVREFERSDLLSALEGNPRELNYWSFKATMSVIARAGNSEQADAATFLRLRREATRSRFDIEYTGNMGSVSKQQNVNNHLFSATSNVFMSKRLFVTPAAVQYFADKFQNIDYRATIGAGVGYYLWRQSKFDWFLQLGGAYQSIQYLSVQEGQDQRTDNGAVIPILSIEWDITSDIEFEFNYNSQIGVPDTKNAFHYLFTVLSIELSDYLDLDTSIQWNHNENPVADADGNVPKRDDYRLAVGIGVDI